MASPPTSSAVMRRRRPQHRWLVGLQRPLCRLAVAGETATGVAPCCCAGSWLFGPGCRGLLLCLVLVKAVELDRADNPPMAENFGLQPSWSALLALLLLPGTRPLCWQHFVAAVAAAGVFASGHQRPVLETTFSLEQCLGPALLILLGTSLQQRCPHTVAAVAAAWASASARRRLVLETTSSLEQNMGPLH